ncbi:hypothetical protein [Dickeya dianthicola]|uniref:hypothetical protein n=1 Tax=Dickeya dianthicola TaxID=204039 RepID=UPI003D7CAB0A
MKLNARQVDTAKPKDKPYKLSDGGGLFFCQVDTAKPKDKPYKLSDGGGLCFRHYGSLQ